ncbi:nucleotidyltransferase family protein [Neolewinella sp.]|uniref:nucleotidyltransferase family protein n=1 Tax=Neolewinella sp. TaxID=2993543 RepID=UPI003B52A3EC
MEDYESLKATDLLLESLSIHPTHEAVGAERAVGTHLHTKEEIATILKEYFKDSKVDRAFLFGSYSRGTQSTVSDIDILISFDEAAKATIFDLVGIKLDLEDIFQRPVDLVQKGTEYDHVKESMEADKVLVYG